MGADFPNQRDLVVLVADANMRATILGLLSRPEALGIRQIDSDVFPHAERDPGCFLQSPDFLASFRPSHRCALVVLDREGSGRDEDSKEPMSRLEMEADLEARLQAEWGDNAAAVVIDPELEAWVWSDSPHVESVLGWAERDDDLRAWLIEQAFLVESSVKPTRPKEAVEKALRLARKPRSSALYRQLAELVSFKRCEDEAFQRFCQILRTWFPPGS